MVHSTKANRAGDTILAESALSAATAAFAQCIGNNCVAFLLFLI